MHYVICSEDNYPALAWPRWSEQPGSLGEPAAIDTALGCVGCVRNKQGVLMEGRAPDTSGDGIGSATSLVYTLLEHLAEGDTGEPFETNNNKLIDQRG
eukprot:882547-Pyramimonas_sp.AAC.1